MGTPYEVSGPRDAAVRRRLRAVAQDAAERQGRPRARQPRHRLHEVAARRHATRARPRSATPRRSRSSGKADVKQVIADLEKITEKASALNVPGHGRAHPAEAHARSRRPRPRTRSRTSRSTSTPAPTTRSCAGWWSTPTCRTPPSKLDAGVLLDLTFTKVGQEQTITAPSNPKPFTELLKAVDAAGLADLGLGGPAPGGGSDSTVPNSSSTPNNVDKYADVHRAGQGRRGEGAQVRRPALRLTLTPTLIARSSVCSAAVTRRQRLRSTCGASCSAGRAGRTCSSRSSPIAIVLDLRRGGPDHRLLRLGARRRADRGADGPRDRGARAPRRARASAAC